MNDAIAQMRALNEDQRNAFIAAFLGWTLDAFDFFLMVFILKDIATAFHVDTKAVAHGLFLTLAFRPVGAFLFGIAADRYGRRIPLMIDVVFYSVMELISGFAPTLTALLIMRALFGIAMGGEWGLGASLAMETIPVKARGMVSGFLQQGYPVGYLLAAIVYPPVFHAFGWRGMFFVGVLPALLSLFIRAKVKESPVWLEGRNSGADRARPSMLDAIQKNWKVFLFMVALMTCFNFMSHGTQDMYPTFLREQHHFDPNTISRITIVFNLGAICGGVTFGVLSERLGRKHAIMLATALGLPMIPLWAYGQTEAALALGGFLMQFMVQGAWGVVPAHLSELSPNALRGTLPGFAYQLGNLFASYNSAIQAGIAEKRGNDYSFALGSVVISALISVFIFTALGPEAKGTLFAEPERAEREGDISPAEEGDR